MGFNTLSNKGGLTKSFIYLKFKSQYYLLYYTIHNYRLHTLVHGKHLLTEIIKHSISFYLSDQLFRWKVGQTSFKQWHCFAYKGGLS